MIDEDSQSMAVFTQRSKGVLLYTPCPRPLAGKTQHLISLKVFLACLTHCRSARFTGKQNQVKHDTDHFVNIGLVERTLVV